MFASSKLFRLVGVFSLALIPWGCEAPGGPGQPEGTGTRFNRAPNPTTVKQSKSALATTEHPVKAETHLAAGRLHESQGGLGQAAEQYRKAIEIAPKCVEAHERLASILDRTGKFQDAEKEYLTAIKLAPDQAYIRNNLGFSYILQRRWSDAENQLREAIEIKPDFARAQVNLGLALAQQEKYDEAFTHFEIALPLEDAHFNIGLMYQSKRKLVEAAKAFKSALDINPNMTAAKNHLKALPTEVLSKADDLRRSEAVASPLPKIAAPTTLQQEYRPATRPAADLNTRLPIEPGTRLVERDLSHPIPRGHIDPPLENALLNTFAGSWAAEILICGNPQFRDWSWLLTDGD